MSSRPHRNLALLIATGATLLLGVVPSAQAAAFRPFAPDSIWNLAPRADAPLHARSAQWAGWMARTAPGHTWLNTDSCAMPTYTAPAGTATVRVRLKSTTGYQDPALLYSWRAVPIPADAKPARCSDKNFAVRQLQADGSLKQWEFWDADKQADGSWTAGWGGTTADVNKDRGIASRQMWNDMSAPSWSERLATMGWNVSASSVAMNAGVITKEDLAQGSIDHALSVAVPWAAAGYFLWPAQRSDGRNGDPNAVPEGAHLRIDPSYELPKTGMTPLGRMIAEAAQKYGIVVRDQTASSVAFYAEEVAPGASNPFVAANDGKSIEQAFAAFPWSKMQVLDAPTCTHIYGCYIENKAQIAAPSSTPVAGSPVELDTTNSTLDQPRTAVRWDLDGNGSYETDGGIAVKGSFTPSKPGTATVGVQITTRDGAVTTATRQIQVAARGTVPTTTTPTVPATPSTPTTPSTSTTTPTLSSTPGPAATTSVPPAKAASPATTATPAKPTQSKPAKGRGLSSKAKKAAARRRAKAKAAAAKRRAAARARARARSTR